MGLAQLRATEMAVKEINAAGGINGKQIEIVKKDSKSKADLSTENARSLIDDDGVKMIFGGSSSGVAVAVSKVAKQNQIPFFGTLTYSTTTTGPAGNRFTFRECYDAWAGAKVLADYMKKNFDGKNTFMSPLTITGATPPKPPSANLPAPKTKVRTKGLPPPSQVPPKLTSKKPLPMQKSKNLMS